MVKVTKLIFVDCLELTFSGVISSDGNYTLSRKQRITDDCFIIYRKGNRIYKFIADVYMNGINIGEIRFIPRKTYRANQPIYFKFNNQILYQANFTNYIEKICKTFNINYQYISLLDLAVDCVDYNIVDFVDNYLHQTKTREKYLTRHKGRVRRKNITTDVDGIIKWGNIRSDKYIKIYNKTAELLDKKNKKSYINLCWKKNGLDTTNKIIERFELTLKQALAKDIDFNKLCDSDHLASILVTHCKNYFEFEKTTMNHGKKWKKDVTPIHFNDFKTELLEKTKLLNVETSRNTRITLKELYFHMAQALFIDLYRLEILDDKFIHEVHSDYKKWHEAINNHLFLHPTLNQYYSDKQKYWAKEFIQKNKIVNGTVAFDKHVDELEKLNIAMNHGLYVLTQAEIKKLISSSYRKNTKQLNRINDLCSQLNKKKIKT